MFEGKVSVELIEIRCTSVRQLDVKILVFAGDGAISAYKIVTLGWNKGRGAGRTQFL